MKNKITHLLLWLLMEYKASHEMLNAQGIATLSLLREEWNINKADKLFEQYCKGEQQ